jgi:DEAD/DEAH box helicase domain-containing protein
VRRRVEREHATFKGTERPSSAVHPAHRGEHVLDVETYWPRAEDAPGPGVPLDVGGMRVSCCVVHDVGSGRDLAFAAEPVPGAASLEALYAFLEACRSEGCTLVGHNVRAFDWEVLAREFAARGLLRDPRAWSPGAARLVDTLASLQARLGWRPSLQVLAWHNFREGKTLEGWQAPQLWAQGRREEVIAYCAKDVDLTRRVWQRGRAEGSVAVDVRDDGAPVLVPVDW